MGANVSTACCNKGDTASIPSETVRAAGADAENPAADPDAKASEDGEVDEVGEVGEVAATHRLKVMKSLGHLEVDEEILRGVSLRKTLRGFGRVWQFSPSDLPLKEREALWKKSASVKSLAFFISHTWRTAGRWKVLALLLRTSWAFVILCWACCMSMVVCLYALEVLPRPLTAPDVGILGLTLTYHSGPWLLVAHVPSILLGFALAPYFPSLKNDQSFLDVTCIHQEDQALMERGVYGLGGFLARSKKLLILWSQPYAVSFTPEYFWVAMPFALVPQLVAAHFLRRLISQKHRLIENETNASVTSSASASRFSTKESVIVTDLIAQSFIKIFNNAFLNTIERVRQPHLINVLKNLKTFAARVPPKYRGSIEKALRTEGFLSFLLSRAAVSLLCAKATLRPSQTKLGREHEELATVVEELYIAALLHAEDQWDLELKADGKTFMAVAASFVKHLADPAPLKTANIQAALLGLDANPLIWTRYGLDLLGISLNSISIGGYDTAAQTEPKDRRKVSLLGGDSLYATAQWAMAKLDSRACRKLIADTIASYSDGQLRKRELLWNLDLTVKQYLEIEKVAGVAAFFGASTACAAFVNKVSDGIAQQLAEFGADLGLVVSLLKDVRTVGMQTALKLGRISAPIIFAMQRDQRLKELLATRLTNKEDFEEALRRVKEYGMMPTIHLVNKLGARAAARLECLEESEEKEALLTLVRGVACLHLMEDGNVSSDDLSSEDFGDPESRVFDMKVANLRLRAQLQRVHSSEQRSKNRLESIQAIARGDDVTLSSRRRTPKGLGLEFDSEEVEWLILRGLERRTPLPQQLDLNHLLSCVTEGRDEVQKRLLALREAAQSTKLKNAITEVFSSGGKRLRPALCLLVHSMLKTEGSADADAAYEKVIVLATSIEIIHTASLVHDDILDDADQRRQQQTMHRIFGPDVAVLSGDFLFAHASGLIESLEDDDVTRLVSLVIEEFGYGELSQSAKRFDASVSLFNYLKKSFYKTASLLAAACRASAVLTGLRCEVCDVLYTYGFYLGLAFQIADDVLDFTGGEELGKPIGQDLAEGNLTAPVILCLQGSEELGLAASVDSSELARLIQRRFSGHGDLERSLQIINESGGVDRAYALAEKMANKALEALTLVAPTESEARRALAGLCRWAVRRSN